MACRECPHCVPYFEGRPVKNKDGYMMVKTSNGVVLEHRAVMEKHIGRRLLRKELVHHKNGNPLDNRIENLKIVTHKQHRKIHAARVKYRKSRITILQAAKKIGITRQAFRQFRERYCLTNQETLDHYVQERGLK